MLEINYTSVTLTRIFSLGSLAWDLWLGVFGLGSLAWISGLGSLAWDLSLGISGLGLGISGLGSLAWDLCGALGLRDPRL